MQFRNKSDDHREIDSLGLVVEQGGTVDVTPEQAAGFVLQCGPDGAWEPVDAKAKAAVAKATAPADDEAPDEVASTETPEPAAPKAKPRARRSAE